MALRHFERVQFRQSPLKLVIGQVQFPILPRVGDQSYVASFLDVFRNDYPRSSREQPVVVQVTTTGISQNAGDPQWRLSTIDQTWSIVLSSNAITLEARKYASVEEFSERFRRIMGAATESLPISERLRLGFRCINEIRMPGVETLGQWQHFLRPEFLGFPASDAFQGEGRIGHSVQQVQIERDDGTLVVRHGLLTGTVVAPLSDTPPDVGPFYLIDLDYYDARVSHLDVSSTVDQLSSYNDVLYDIFRWTLLSPLYEALEPTRAG